MKCCLECSTPLLPRPGARPVDEARRKFCKQACQVKYTNRAAWAAGAPAREEKRRQAVQSEPDLALPRMRSDVSYNSIADEFGISSQQTGTCSHLWSM